VAVSGIPKYQSISNDLRRRITDGEIAPGQQLAAQHALAQEYGVSVMTLRQALADLETEGLVHAVKGKGTFVSEPPSVRYDLDHLWSFTQEMTDQGVEVATEVLAVHLKPETADLDRARRALGLDRDATLIEVVRRRSIAGKPVVLQRSFLAEFTWSKIAAVDLTASSLYDVLAEACGLVLDRASETLRAVALNAEDASTLDVEPGLASLESVRVSTTRDGTLFLYDRALLSGTATEVRAERSAGGMRVGYQAR
jgi:GntR family transcriptional regulator